MSTITDDERKFIRHALGLDNREARGIGYRNRYFAMGDSIAIGRALEAKGMAISDDVTEEGSVPVILFRITTAGFNAVKQGRERMDREETAYMAKLDAQAMKGEGP